MLASMDAADAAALINPVVTRTDWDAMRAAVLADPGAFHGDIAARTIHWFVAEVGRSGACCVAVMTDIGRVGTLPTALR